MKSSHPLHNPFYNRFNDPVRRRHDDMQAQAYSLWLKEQNRVLPPRVHSVSTDSQKGSLSLSTRIAGALMLVVVLLISAGVLLKSL